MRVFLCFELLQELLNDVAAVTSCDQLTMLLRPVVYDESEPDLTSSERLGEDSFWEQVSRQSTEVLTLSGLFMNMPKVAFPIEMLEVFD